MYLSNYLLSCLLLLLLLGSMKIILFRIHKTQLLNNTAVDEIIEGWPLRDAQLEQEEKIRESVKVIEHEGYDTGKGYKIDLSYKGAADLTGAVVLAKEAVETGYDGEHYVLDSNGLTQSVSYEELIQLGIDYGLARILCTLLLLKRLVR